MSRPLVLLYHPRGDGQALPLALLQIGSMLPEFDVRIIDGRVELTPESTLAELAENAVCLGVTVLSGKPVINALRASRAVKRRSPRLPVIWGGWHPSLLPGQCLASASVDACVFGQGEETFREIVLKLAAGQGLGEVKGASFKRDGAVVENPRRAVKDLNSLPSTNFGLIDLERYFAVWGERRLDYCSSRSGAPGASIRSDPGAGSRGWSALDPGRVVAEITDHATRYRLDQVRFNDDDFFADLVRAEAIAQGLVEAGVGIPWIGTGRARLFQGMTPEQLALLRQSGCCRVNVGPARGDALAPGAHAEVIESAKKLNRAGIGARFSFIAGHPNERASALAETYRTVKNLRKINGGFETPIHFYAPYPGAEAWDRPPGLGFEAPQRLEDWEGLDLDDSIGPWIPESVRKFVPRYNFYLRHAFEPVEHGLGKRVARWFAKRRVRHDFYRFDVERRLVDLSKRVRTGMPPRPQLTTKGRGP